jgi:type I restriction enzyme, S subunit
MKPFNAFSESDLMLTELGLIPSDWSIVTLSEVSQIVMGQSPNSNTYNEDGQGLPFFQGKAEFGNRYPIPAKWCSAPIKIANPGATLVSVRAPVGDVNINPLVSCIGRGLAAVHADPSLLDESYLFYILLFLKPRLEQQGTGSTFQSINSNVLKQLQLPLPPLAEQQRIATVLNTLQDEIAAQEDIIAAAKDFKRSLMQRLFTYGSGAEPAPTKMTEIGEIPAHWDVVTLSDISKKITDGAHHTPTYVEEGIPFLRVTDIQSNLINWSKVKRIPEHEHNQLIIRCNPQRGDILLSKNGTIGITKVVDWDEEFSVFVSLCVIKPMHERINSTYLAQYLSSNGLPQILERGKKMTVTNLHLVEIKQLLIPVPSLGEQTAIEVSLNDADYKIAVEEKRKAALQDTYRSLLHQLMTGQIRLHAS